MSDNRIHELDLIDINKLLDSELENQSVEIRSKLNDYR